MSRKGSRATRSSTKQKDAGGGTGDDYEGVSGESSEESLALLSEDVMLIDKIYAKLTLRSLDDPISSTVVT